MKILLVITPLIALIGGCLTFYKFEVVEYEAVVVEKVYKPAAFAVQTGYTTAGDGGMVVTTSNEPESFTLVVRRVDTGRIQTKRVDAETWATATNGARIYLTETKMVKR